MSPYVRALGRPSKIADPPPLAHIGGQIQPANRCRATTMVLLRTTMTPPRNVEHVSPGIPTRPFHSPHPRPNQAHSMMSSTRHLSLCENQTRRRNSRARVRARWSRDQSQSLAWPMRWVQLKTELRKPPMLQRLLSKLHDSMLAAAAIAQSTRRRTASRDRRRRRARARERWSATMRMAAVRQRTRLSMQPRPPRQRATRGAISRRSGEQ